MSDPASPHDFRPAASWANLRLRADLLRRLREFFHQAGFLEVETPVLSADTVVDRHLDPFELGRSGTPCLTADKNVRHSVPDLPSGCKPLPSSP